jgi:PAS domain S-box-containing protein
MDEGREEFICGGTDISVLRQAGGECRSMDATYVEKAARLQAILDTTVDGIITIDELAIIQSFNRAAEKIFGYSASEVIGRNVNVLQPSPYREHHDEYVANYLRTGIRKIIGIGREVMGLRKDGSTFPLYLAVSEVKVGKKRYFAAILRDLSEQKEAIEEIRNLARFPEENPHPILRVAREGTLLYANSASECLLDTWGCGVGQVLPEMWRGVVLEVLEVGLPKDLEVQCGVTTYALTFVPSPDARDINVYGKDITERKIAEETLRASEEKHRALVQSSSDAILVIDENRRIISFNQAFLDLFGFEGEEVEGQSTRIIHPSDESYSAFREKAFAVIEAKGSFRTEWKLARKDKSVVPVEETLSAIRSSGGNLLGLVAIIRDISERRESEKRLEEYRDRLEEMVMERTAELEKAYKAMLQEEKLKTLGTISSEMAHEIRNPLMSIGGFARRLQKMFPQVPEIGIIVQESVRLEGILKRIENYLKPVEMRPRECSVNSIIKDALELISPELERDGIRVTLTLAPELPFAYVDPGILIQVIVNVIHNAAKVMRKDGKITIETSESDQNVHITVGAPIREKIKDPEHVFMPFGENREEISVPICFRLLRSMGGNFSLTQEGNAVVFAAALLKVLRGAG